MKTIEIIEFGLFFVASILYIVYIIKNKKFTPNALAFGIWLAADIVNLTYLDFSEFWIAPVLMVICASIIFTIALIRNKKSEQKLNVRDLNWRQFSTIGIVFASILIWIFSKDSIVANLCVQAALAMGFIPIIEDLFIHKKQEPLSFWFIFLLGFIVLLFHTSIEYQRWEELVYPIVGFVGELIIVSLIIYNNTKAKFAERV